MFLTQLENKTYKNSNCVPNGVYQNLDMTFAGKIFAKTDGDNLWLTNRFDKLKKEKLSREIYFRPESFPLTDPFDYRKSSCFVNWFVPTASFIFEVCGNSINVSTVENDLSLASYITDLYDQITQEILNLYQNHDTVYLHYSGGIDAIVSLSFLIKLNLLHKTKILTYRSIQPDSNSVYFDNNVNNQLKVRAIKNLFSDLGDQLLETIVSEVTPADLLSVINTEPHNRAVAYCTTTMLKRYTDGAHFGGHYGNQSFLHWFPFVDDLLLAGHQIDDYNNLCNDPTTYSKIHVKSYGVSKDVIPLRDKHLLLRTRMSLVNGSGATFYHPLMNNHVAQNIRRLNYKEINFDYLLNARLARQLIHENCGAQLDSYIVSDGADGDVIVQMDLEYDKIDPAIFDTFTDLNHNAEGIQWHKYEINLAEKSGRMPVNTLISFKAIETLHKLASGKLSLFSPDTIKYF